VHASVEVMQDPTGDPSCLMFTANSCFCESCWREYLTLCRPIQDWCLLQRLAKVGQQGSCLGTCLLFVIVLRRQPVCTSHASAFIDFKCDGVCLIQHLDLAVFRWCGGVLKSGCTSFQTIFRALCVQHCTLVILASQLLVCMVWLFPPSWICCALCWL
jgi:hypothetical protein